MTDIAFSTAADIAERIRRRELGSLEATDYFIERIERLDGDVNAVAARDFDRAREAARAADRAREPVGPLHGVPMTVKESNLDQPGWRLDLPRASKSRLSDYRVAVWADDENSPVDHEIADRAASIGETLSRLGARVSDTARPAIDVRGGYETYLELLHSVMAAGVGPEKTAKNQRYAAQTDPADRSDRAIMSRAMVLSHAGWLGANGRREHLRYAWREFFESWDVLVCPQMATTAFPHDHSPMQNRTVMVNGEHQPYFQQLFWSGLVTGAYLPSTVFPAGLSSEGLPIGLQAVGAAYHDHVTIEFARLLAQEIGGFQAPPGY